MTPSLSVSIFYSSQRRYSMICNVTLLGPEHFSRYSITSSSLPPVALCKESRAMHGFSSSSSMVTINQSTGPLSTCEQGLDQLSINCQPNQWSIASLNSEEQGHSVASAVFANSTRIHPIFTFPLYDVHCTPVLKRDILLFLRCVAF